jgi:hypothetical protein
MNIHEITGDLCVLPAASLFGIEAPERAVRDAPVRLLVGGREQRDIDPGCHSAGSSK